MYFWHCLYLSKIRLVSLLLSKLRLSWSSVWLFLSCLPSAYMKQFRVVNILDTNARGLYLRCWFLFSLLLKIQPACIETSIQSCWLNLLSFCFQILQLIFEMILKHSLNQYYFSFFLLCLEGFLSLDLISSLMLKVGSIFKEISPWARITDL